MIRNIFALSIAIVMCESAFGIELPRDIDDIRKMYSKDSSHWEKPLVDEGVQWQEIGALPDEAPYPESNPYSEAKAKLGERLFNDPKLSLSNQIACASCHDKEQGYSNGRSVSYGHDRALGRRNAPSVVMSAFGREKFWDGRAESLEAQVSFPIADKKEMAYDIGKAAKKLNKIESYKADFKAAFGDGAINSERIAQAIATYERSLMPKTSRFDRFIRGNVKALSDEEVWGLHIFRTKARCMNCHSGVAFSDEGYHNLGLSWYGRKYQDLGRYEVTKNPQDSGKFKTPSLRGVAKSAPYMHNGKFPHLKGVLNAYNKGMYHLKPKTPEQENDPLFPLTDNLLHELNLSKDELQALEAFLGTL
ncbi:cytochrome-c peroxidase [Helicobacter fennelliae]|uniref:Methylamine utilization protein MauG n=1 Tax=Helicobacter fennelliae TaxID=215 RepID=A0A2X3BA23_9HELI|nr:cytochrome c peroxidase [Helicobacter fennelliae]SQB97433.1 putative cytochrome-c peroxidase [Helicobacter fennelliae]